MEFTASCINFFNLQSSTFISSFVKITTSCPLQAYFTTFLSMHGQSSSMMYHFNKLSKLSTIWHRDSISCVVVSTSYEYHFISTLNGLWHAKIVRILLFLFFCSLSQYKIMSKLYHSKWKANIELKCVVVYFFFLHLFPPSTFNLLPTPYIKISA